MSIIIYFPSNCNISYPEIVVFLANKWQSHSLFPANYLQQIKFCLGLRIKETKEVYEGEVTELTPEETENPLGGYGA
jgi:hypothetical protein